MDQNIFEAISDAFRADGPQAALAVLLESFLREGDLRGVFEARTMLARHEFGLSLMPGASRGELDPSIRDAVEARLVEACRDVGQAMLERGDIAGGYQYLQMIGELEPVRARIDSVQAPTPEELAAIVEIAVGRGVHPRRGVALVLQNYGICQAITACESLFAQGVSGSDREACIGLLVRALYQDLTFRVRQEIEEREPATRPDESLDALLSGREWLFENDNYHVDTSHLNAIVRMARMLRPGTDMELAVGLCEYGRRLSDRYRYPDPSPFEDVYANTKLFLQVLLGDNIESGLAYFRARAEAADPSEAGTYPAEVYLHLLRGVGRQSEAVEFAGQRLGEVAGPLVASINEICVETGRYDVMARLARSRNDPLSFTAAILAGGTAAPAGRTQ